MLKVVNMPGVKTVFLEEIEKLYGVALRTIMEAAADVEPGQPLDEERLRTVRGAADPHEFTCKVEGLLDDAIELCSEVEQHSETSGVVGKLEKFTLKDNFALAIDVMDSPENSALLYEMKQEKYVRIESVQQQLALDDGVPEDGEAADQMELGEDTPEDSEAEHVGHPAAA